MKKLLYIAALLSLAGCVKNYAITTSAKEMGSCDGTVFTSDEGIRYTITEDKSEEPLGAQERVYVDFDILQKNSAGYDIRVLSWRVPLTKAWLKESVLAGDEDLGNDPIRVTGGWFSGGYLNLDVSLIFTKDSETKHFLNLVLNDVVPDPDTLRLSMRHNGYGESPTAEQLNAPDPDGVFVRGVSTVCFPYAGLLPEGKEEMPFKITSPWYVADEEGTYTVSEVSIIGTLTAD